MSSLPPDHLERVYAGVLGKIIGVLLGRPFEMWSHERILDELGLIKYYVHDKLGVPLVVIDDDISGTFTFVRALEEHGAKAELTAEEVGKTWLNNVIEKRCVFWWGGNGISTEHTAYKNLKKGIAAPASGSMRTNGKTIAEQIGAQIFIDGFALVAPGKPELAAQLADAAARVSHDGEAVYAAKLWAAMEAEAFVSKDVDHLLDTGLKVIPADSTVARLISDVRTWCKEDDDWQETRQRIDNEYGYHRYHGVCHVIPNHGIMIMALIYSGSFHEAMHIINTCGWDTDCNSGNIGCLVAILHGLKGFEGGPDWRGPIADRAIISSADGGYSINDASRIALNITNTGRKLAGEDPWTPLKNGAQFHFSLPGSVQGFQASPIQHPTTSIRVQQDMNSPIAPALAIRYKDIQKNGRPIEVLTDTFIPKNVLEHRRDYELMASPLVYPGQQLEAFVHAARSNSWLVIACIRIHAYNSKDDILTVDSPPVPISSGGRAHIKWEIPLYLENQPICKVGIALSHTQDSPISGTVYLESLKYHGTPCMTFRRLSTGPADISGVENMWHRSFVNAVDVFHTWGPSFFIAHDHGEGIISTGTRDWYDYRVTASKFVVNLGAPAGLAVRVRGLNRWYALMFVRGGRVALVKARDGQRMELIAKAFDWSLDEEYSVCLEVEGTTLRGTLGGMNLEALDEEYESGGIGLVVTDGSLSADSIEVRKSNGLD